MTVKQTVERIGRQGRKKNVYCSYKNIGKRIMAWTAKVRERMDRFWLHFEDSTSKICY